MLKEEIENFIEKKGFNMDAIEQAFKIDRQDILKNLPEDIAVVTSGSNFDDIISDIENWGEVLVVKSTPSFIMEIKTKISKGTYARGYYNLSTQNAALGGHLKADAIETIVFLSAKVVMGMLSHAVCFYDKNAQEIFKIYVARDEKREFIKEQEQAYKNLRKRYS